MHLLLFFTGKVLLITSHQNNFFSPHDLQKKEAILGKINLIIEGHPPKGTIRNASFLRKEGMIRPYKEQPS
jgi:hypothetical protein